MFYSFALIMVHWIESFECLGKHWFTYTLHRSWDVTPPLCSHLSVLSSTSCFVSCCCCCSVAPSCLTLCDPMDCSMPGLPVPHHLPEFTQVHVHCIGDAIQPSHLLKPSSPSAIDLSQDQGLFQWVVVQIRWPKYWCFTFSISPSSEYSGLISLKINWFDLLAVQGTFRSVL